MTHINAGPIPFRTNGLDTDGKLRMATSMTLINSQQSEKNDRKTCTDLQVTLPLLLSNDTD